jgi:hypothetical protein
MNEPWNNIERRDGEKAIDWACRKVAGMTLWHKAHKEDLDRIATITRDMVLVGGRDTAPTFYNAAMDNLYRRFPECPTEGGA